MNFSKSILTILFASLLFVGCKEKTDTKVMADKVATEAPKVKKEIAAANLQTASFTIKGMVCAVGCAKTIEDDLNNTDGVQKAAVDFDKESATIAYDKTVLNPESITKLVEATGDGKTYKVSDFK
jgi:periplasmic mercuric ion binding protein